MSRSWPDGQSVRHTAFREWTEAALGDPRQIYAQKAGAPPGAPLVFMPDGQAPLFRAAAKSGALICPVPGCPSPRLIARAYRDKRDHFAHVRAPADKKHRRSYLRLATHRLLHEWMARQERVVKILRGEREGIALLLAACLDDGSKVALCYVDQRLGADAWDELNKALHLEGLATAWIFALEKSYFDPPDPAEPLDEERMDLILDKAIYRRMRKKGSWPLLINLDRQEFANVIKPGGRPARDLGLVPPDLDRVMHFYLVRLADCRLCQYGIETPAIGESILRAGANNWWRR